MRPHERSMVATPEQLRSRQLAQHYNAYRFEQYDRASYYGN
eukprot:CAMPEP_0185623826 /NCGR_PEP_ID=MMETSP0436-20130131/60149_1 /TAXON_ID=626734 ORGANISM="Favella taraikaensis, Strain Fe Narragansett Bay" /NCGR_SAMPLE_ID=MMETSP0436 /ASSEMBLY_ACC=CAM_ASM_000390 /LENGTH=40 /DNA_ID= /DNA_START= /DNA_END= /DNA_ORIENTATION=